MVSLVDIVPQTRKVQIAAGELELRGLGLRQIADLFLMFPSLRNLFTAGAPEITAADFIMWAPEAIGTIIAFAAGQPEAAETIADARSGITPDECFTCLDVIYDLTFPRGITPFLQRALPYFAPLLRSNGAADPGAGQGTNAPREPSNSSPADMLAAK
jgi:hypothetical protein